MLRSILSTLLFSLSSLPLALAGPPTFDLVSIYDYPSTTKYPVTATFGGGIADRGESVGSFLFTSSHFERTESFERSPNGDVTAAIIFPAGPGTNTFAAGINNAGLIIGTYQYLNQNHGFFYDGQTYTQYDGPGADSTDLYGLNDAGDFVGIYLIFSTDTTTGFVSIGGAMTPIEIPGARFTQPFAINNLGQVVGIYPDPDNSGNGHGFFRDADGTLTYPLDYPGSISTLLFGLNDRGEIVGAWLDSNFGEHGLYLTLPNHFSSYDGPSGSTVLRGINIRGRISGQTGNTVGDIHGIIVHVKR